MQVSDILDPSLGDLEFDKNRMLFLWPADLVAANPDPVGGPLDAIHEKSLEDWKYPVKDETVPIGWRDRPVQEAPEGGYKQIREMQDRIGDAHEQVAPDVLARPTSTAVFGLMQHQLSRSHVESYKIQSLELDMSAIISGLRDPATYDDYWEGVIYSLNAVSKAVVDVSLLNIHLAMGLGLEGSAQVIAEHLRRKPKEHIEHHISHFREYDYGKMVHAKNQKSNRIREQIMLWQSAGRQLVINADGTPNVPCSLSNTATALIGVRQLAEISMSLHVFHVGAEQAIASLIEAL